MKKLITLSLLIVLVWAAVSALRRSGVLAGTSLSSDCWVCAGPETFTSKEEMHQAINDAKSNKRSSLQKLADIDYYYDFAWMPDDIHLSQISIKQSYVILKYSKGAAPGVSSLSLSWTRFQYGGDYDHLQFALENHPSYELVTINGIQMAGGAVYNDTGQLYGYSYYFVVDGEYLEVFCPSWLWESYSDEMFLNIKKVTLPN